MFGGDSSCLDYAAAVRATTPVRPPLDKRRAHLWRGQDAALSVRALAARLPLLRDNQNPSSSDNLAYIRWWSSVRWASWCQARSRQRRGPKGPGFTPA